MGAVTQRQDRGTFPRICRKLMAMSRRALPIALVLPLALASCEQVTDPMPRIQPMSASEHRVAPRPTLPALDLEQPREFETATFGLG